MRVKEETRNKIRDAILETFYINERETLDMFEDDIGRIYKLIEETPVTNTTQKVLLEEAVADREKMYLAEIIESAATRVFAELTKDEMEDTDW